MNSDTYDTPFVPVAAASAPTRAAFYRKTYLTAAGAFGAWALVLTGLFASGAAVPIMKGILSLGQVGWLLVLGAFWLATSFGSKLAFSMSKGTQLLGLAIYVVAEAVIFVPLISMVVLYCGGRVETAMSVILGPALLATGALFAGLTASVFLTRVDFSFLKTFVVIGSFAALGAILVFSIFGVNFGTWFAFAMVALMGAAILWQTWQIKEQFDARQHIGAATMVFAGFMTLLWYVIQIFLSRRD